MRKLLEAINRGILRGLSESNIELLTDVDDSELDLLDSLLTKNINHKIHALYTHFPKTKDALAEIIKAEVEKKGWKCDLNHIDVSQITDMSRLFSTSRRGYKLEKFNGDISRWDVSNVTSMECMFYESEFNGDIARWDVNNVTNMYGMFCNAESFNQPIGDWDVSNVITMSYMFAQTKSFNQPIGDWDVTKVTNMRCMFCDAKAFNQDLSKWEINNCCITNDMFYKCSIKKGYKPKGIK